MASRNLRCVSTWLGLAASVGASIGSCVVWTEHRERADSQVRPIGTTGQGGEGAGSVGGSAAGGSTSGGGGAGAEGGSGGGVPTACMPPTEHPSFEIETTAICLVAKYEAALEVDYLTSPTWGRHEGPLTASYAPAPDDEATVTRWQVPTGPTGTLTADPITMSVGISASTVYFGAEALDLPFGGWTLLSWTGDWGSTDGEALLVTSEGVQAREPVVGLFGAGGLAGSTTGRVLYTGLGSFGDTTSAPVPGLYAADFCPGPDSCASALVAAWGEATGPVAVDDAGNVFVVQTAYSTEDQEIRGFPASSVAPGAAATEGTTVLTLPGFGSELAAMGPAGNMPGILLFQPFDSETFLAGDVVAVAYSVVADTLAAGDTAVPAITLATAGTAVSLMTDSGGRLWLGMVTEPGVTTFFVLDRTPTP